MLPFAMFTDKARMVVMEAQAESAESGHGVIDTEHILIGLLREGSGLAWTVLTESGVSLQAVRGKLAAALPVSASSSGVDAASALAAIGIDLDAVRHAIEASFGEGALQQGGPPDRFTAQVAEVMTPQVSAVVGYAYEAAAMLRCRYIGTEHLLLGLLREGDGLACTALADLGVDLSELARQTRRQAAPAQARAEKSLDRLSDLTRQLSEHGPDQPRLADARALMADTWKRSLSDEHQAVIDAAVRYADRLDSASDQIEAAIRALPQS